MKNKITNIIIIVLLSLLLLCNIILIINHFRYKKQSNNLTTCLNYNHELDKKLTNTITELDDCKKKSN